MHTPQPTCEKCGHMHLDKTGTLGCWACACGHPSGCPCQGCDEEVLRRAAKAVRQPHLHCPFDCEHPQPFTLAKVQADPAHQQYAGKTFCGKCHHDCGIMTEMVPCTLETCPEEAGAA